MIEYVHVTDLPQPVISALAEVKYGKCDIRVEHSEKVHLGNSGSGAGRQAFTVLIDLDSGKHQAHYGSWGGVNMFERTNAVDNDQHAYPLPGNGVAITGSRGGGHPVMATLHVPASMVSHILTAGPVDPLPKVELDALYCHGCIKGGEYRRDELRRRDVPSGVVDDLVTRGLLKRNKAGATAITTEGRNALGDHR